MRRTLADERGLSVAELAVAMGLSLVVFVPILSTLTAGVGAQTYHQSKSETLDTVRGAVNRLTKETRQALWIDPASDLEHLSMQTFVGGGISTVSYDVVDGILGRTVDGGGTEPLIAGVQPGAGFAYDPLPSVEQPTTVTVMLSVRPASSRAAPVVLETSVHLRNRS